MEKSQTITELAKALVAFQSEMKTVGFDANNPFFKSKYATLSALVETSKPVLAKNGLAVSQLTEGEGGITTILMHTSGEYLFSTLTLKPSKDDPQGRGSAITYARRYAYAAILGLVSDEDDDGNAATQTAKPAAKQANPQPVNRVPPGNGKGNGEKPLTVREIVVNMGKQLFKTPDEFKLWRVNNNYCELLDNANEYEFSLMLMALKDKENGAGNVAHK